MERKPTKTGVKAYPPNGYYMETHFHEEYPCTCTERCGPNCKGECGCKACSACWNDFLSSER